MEQIWEEIRSNIEENRFQIKKSIKKLIQLNKRQFVTEYHFDDLVETYYHDIHYNTQKDHNYEDTKLLCDFCEKITQFHNQKYILKCIVPTIQQQKCIEMVLNKNEEAVFNNFIHFKQSLTLFNECFLHTEEIEPESLTKLY